MLPLPMSVTNWTLCMPIVWSGSSSIPPWRRNLDRREAEAPDVTLLVETKSSAMFQRSCGSTFWTWCLRLKKLLCHWCIFLHGCIFYMSWTKSQRGRIEMSLIVISYIVTNGTTGLVFKPNWKLRASSSPFRDSSDRRDELLKTLKWYLEMNLDL